MEIVIASQNLHKIREFRSIFKPSQWLDFSSLRNFADYEPPEEVGSTFEENAILKAKHAAAALNQWTLADDSGLVVPSLGGDPGIYSRRYAGDDATDAENRQKLMKALSEKKGLDRSAYYECCLALVNPAGELVKCVRGICEGYICEKEKGRNGFGYDPVFSRNETDTTFAELDEATKNRISHRAKACQKILIVIESSGCTIS